MYTSSICIIGAFKLHLSTKAKYFFSFLYFLKYLYLDNQKKIDLIRHTFHTSVGCK